ncbi:MAG TPA: lipoyl(octanoyl) transferase LipB [Candidatus Saccharimonadales bacterium]|nr:lipoyl(octanoyl) transferase LipB [Candidatus Saccharimonadales bacterium]
MTTEGYLLDLSRQEYSTVLQLQHELVDLRGKNKIPDTLILVEHNPTFTVGKSITGEIPSEINGIPVIQIERGGQWTYHGPGQLVGYPILDLQDRRRDIHDFIRTLEETLILALAEFKIPAERSTLQAGVWVNNKKIASIGAAIRRWITFHGFALNVNTDLNYFTMITPCGLPSSTMTSMSSLLNRDIEFDSVKETVKRTFQATFQLQLRPMRVNALAQVTPARPEKTAPQFATF